MGGRYTMNACEPRPARLATEAPITRATFDEVMVPCFAPAGVLPVRGEGSRVWDQAGREYIDFAAGVAVTALGHCHPVMRHALEEQAGKLWHISNWFTNEPALKLARSLVQRSFADRVFLCNSGAEANEAALKLARKYAADHFGPEKNGIVSTLHSFHGRTLFTVTAGGTERYRQGFGPLPSSVTHIGYNDVAALEAAIGPQTCAVILEPVQGEGGVNPGRVEFLQAARALCDRHQALLILDEIQTGMGRTGTLFNHEQKGIIPDIMTSAKGLGGGFPVGAMLSRAVIAASFSPGTHGTTYGGNPLAAAVASAVLEVIDTPEMLAGVRQRAARLRAGLVELGRRLEVFREVRGEGLLIGCELVPRFAGRAADFMAAGSDAGVFFLMAGTSVLRFLPALNIPHADLDEGLARLETALAQVK
ncbi:succinylornithine aminotransferase [Burkholderiales bacterium]|nr:succinylornithine aminotransferase [Burkholderiales bacterium]